MKKTFLLFAALVGFGFFTHGADRLVRQAHDTPTHLIDMMATCVDPAGATYPTTFRGKTIAPMQGQGIRPLFSGSPSLPIFLSQRPLRREHQGNAAIRVGDHKLVRAVGKGGWELCHMKTDLTEQHDLEGARPDEVKRLAAPWTVWAKSAKNGSACGDSFSGIVQPRKSRKGMSAI